MTAVEPRTETERVEAAVEAFLADHDPRSMDKVAFRGAQYDAGLAWMHFPEGQGGLGVAPTLHRIVDQQLRAAGAPGIDATQFFGLALAGPTIVSHGSDDLEERTLRRMFTGEDAWCQLFSEPGQTFWPFTAHSSPPRTARHAKPASPRCGREAPRHCDF